MEKAKRLAVAVLLAGCATAPLSAQASTVTLDANLRGWFSSNGFSNYGSALGNYITGLDSPHEFRGAFRFSLAGQSGTVTAVSLLLDAMDIVGNDDADVSIFDASATSPDFTDLGTGTVYSSGTFARRFGATTVQTLNFVFNSAGISAVQSALGSSFAVGSKMLPFDTSQIFAFSNGSTYSTRLQITFQDAADVPVPATLGLMLGGFAALAGLRRRA